MIDRVCALLSRKFLIALICAIGTLLLKYLTKIDDGTFERVIYATVGVYMASNIAQKKLIATTTTTESAVTATEAS